MFLKQKRQGEISSIFQLGTILYEIAYLREYRYFNSPRYILKTTPTRESVVINFFNVYKFRKKVNTYRKE